MARDNGYHRADLRGELVAAGLEVVAAEGHATLSVRTLAQKVGVSAGAPYHHFPDRRSLLLALAQEGFRHLIGSAVSLMESDLPPVEKLIGLGESFMNFAISRPRLLELMYESELTRPDLDPSIREAQLMGYRALKASVAEQLPTLQATDLDIRVVTLWSTLYGFASLRIKNMIQPFEPSALTPEDVVKAVVKQAVREALTVREAGLATAGPLSAS